MQNYAEDKRLNCEELEMSKGVSAIKNYSLWPFSQTEFSIDICVYEFDYILIVAA